MQQQMCRRPISAFLRYCLISYGSVNFLLVQNSSWIVVSSQKRFLEGQFFMFLRKSRQIMPSVSFWKASTFVKSINQLQQLHTKVKQSNFEFADVGVGLSPLLLLVHLGEEVGALVVLHVVLVQVVLGSLGHRLRLELGHPSVFYLLVQFLPHLFLVPLPSNPLVLQSLPVLVLLLLGYDLLLDVLGRLFSVAPPHGDGDLLLADDHLVLRAGAGSGSEVAVREGIEVVVHFFEGFEDLLLQFVGFVVAQPEKVLELGFVEFPEPQFAFLFADFFEAAVLFPENVRVLVTHSVIVELIQNSLFDHVLQIRVVLWGDILIQSNPRLELQVVLEQAVCGSLGPLDFTPEHPILFVDDFVLQFFDLFFEVSFFECGLGFFCLVLNLNLSEVVELIVDDVFPLIFPFPFLLLVCISLVFGSDLLLFFLELPFLLGVALIFIGLHLLLIYLLPVKADIVFALVNSVVFPLHLLQIVFVFFLLNMPVRIFVLLLFFVFFILLFVDAPVILLFRDLFGEFSLVLRDAGEQLFFVLLVGMEGFVDRFVYLGEDLLIVHVVGGYGGVRVEEGTQGREQIEQFFASVQLFQNQLVQHC